MQKIRLMQWCQVATSRIRFDPDRQMVFDELLAHLEDHRDALTAQGYDEQTATDLALQAMGDAKEIAPQLAAIHRPFWGYLLRVSKILLIVLLILSIWPIWDYITDLPFGSQTIWQRQFAVFDSTSYGGDTGRTLYLLSQPNVSFSDSGNRFTLTDAAFFSTDGKKNILMVHIQQSSLLPWTEQEAYLPLFYPATAFFTARDDLGNEYRFLNNQDQNTTHTINGVQTGLFSYTHEIWLNNFPRDAQWVDICYARDGRDYALRVYLTGGDHT